LDGIVDFSPVPDRSIEVTMSQSLTFFAHSHIAFPVEGMRESAHDLPRPKALSAATRTGHPLACHGSLTTHSVEAPNRAGQLTADLREAGKKLRSAC